MTKPLRVLIVEDSMDDALLLVRELRKGGYEPAYERLDTREAMDQSLDRQAWDIVISDYVMPNFSGLAALALLQEKGLDLPFIMVSGKIGEETAVETLKAGAHDYVLKDNLKRLVPTVERELRDAEVRRDKRRFEEERNQMFGQLRSVNEQLTVYSIEVKHGEEECRRLIAQLDAIITSLVEAVVVCGPNGETLRTNPIAADLLGVSSKEQAKPITELWLRLRPEMENGKSFLPENAPPIRALRGETVRGVVSLVHRASDGKPIWVSISASPVLTPEGKSLGAVAIFTDISSLRLQRGVTGLSD